MRAIVLKSDFASGYVEAGLLENNMGEFESAEEHLKRALQLTGDQGIPALRGRIYYGLAAVRANKGDFNKAHSLLDESLRILPSFQPALQLRHQLDSAR
jgi:tetratricopeptide (TPR) repeat protein